jgi:hypothetical protein
MKKIKKLKWYERPLYAIVIGVVMLGLSITLLLLSVITPIAVFIVGEVPVVED